MHRIQLTNAVAFLSTPSGWRATEYWDGGQTTAYNFYPRPPGGGRPYRVGAPSHTSAFLSTPSGWRATGDEFFFRHRFENFYPRPPGGGRLIMVQYVSMAIIFLSTPSGWRATFARYGILGIYGFLSTPSGWRATKYPHQYDAKFEISIHALRVEGDRVNLYDYTDPSTDFYPRPPGGGRHDWRAVGQSH